VRAAVQDREAPASDPATHLSLSSSSPNAAEMLSSIFGAPRFTAKVTTGDRLGAGTNSTVWMQLVDSTGKVSEKTCLDKTFVNDHQRGATHTYNVSHKGLDKPEDIAYIILWRDRTPVADDSWLLDKIVVIIFYTFRFLKIIFK
jgi:PLAT/LH2 domain